MDTGVKRVGDENARPGVKPDGIYGARPAHAPARAALQPVDQDHANRHRSGPHSKTVSMSQSGPGLASSAFPRDHGRQTSAPPPLKRKHDAERDLDLDLDLDLDFDDDNRGAQATADALTSEDTIEDSDTEANQARVDEHTVSMDLDLDLDEDELVHHDHSHVLDVDSPDAIDQPPLPLALKTTSNPHALFPVVTAESRRELVRCANVVKNTRGMLDHEDEDLYDISMVAEYSEDIFAYMRKLEAQMRPDPAYMDRQQEIQWSMRGILVDWLVQVHHRFGLLPETLFLTINYIDRFLSLKAVSLPKFQLVGAVALFLAAKYEEINCPSVNEIVYMVDRGYEAEEVLTAEKFMIDMLDFNLGFPGPMSFLRRTSKADDYDLETRTLAKYLLEITIMDQRFVASPPSWTAAVAHFLSRHMLQKGPWTDAHIFFSGYTHDQLIPGVEVLKECCRSPLEHHRAIYEKYSDRRFRRAALFVSEWIRHGFE